LEKEKVKIEIIYNNTELTAELQNEGGSDFRIINFKEKAGSKSNRPKYNTDDLAVFEKRNNSG
jgi:hypothetical protein